MKTVAVIQARTLSTRLPGKVLHLLSGKPLIWHVVNRLTFSKKIDRIVLATTTNPSDDKLVEWAENNNVDICRGSEEDVLGRFYHAATLYDADFVVRVTADDPFKDPEVIDSTVKMVYDNELDFGFNNFPPSFPEGLDVEVFTFKALETAHIEAKDPYEREHVTQYFYRNEKRFKTKNFASLTDYSHLRWTIDTAKDFEMAAKVYEELFREGNIFYYQDIINFLQQKPEIMRINMDEARSAMYIKNDKI